MIIEKPTEEQMNALLPLEKMKLWNNLVKKIEERYDVDQIWSKGFGDWIYEYKFRRGGKTLCTLYMKNENANILITLGKAEREKYEADRKLFSASMNDLYVRTDSLHDGKWLWIPIEFDWNDISMLLRIKRRPNK
jgi:hypothetical protein